MLGSLNIPHASTHHVICKHGQFLLNVMEQGTCTLCMDDKYQVLHRYSYFSWWWAHSRPKHVEKRNTHTKKNCAPSWLYLQDYTGMHEQNIQYCIEIRIM